MPSDPIKEFLEKNEANIKDTIKHLIEKDKLLEALLVFLSEIDMLLGSLIYDRKKGKKNEIHINKYDEIIALRTRQKINLCYGLHCIDEGLRYKLLYINGLRNKYVHHIEARLIINDEDYMKEQQERTNAFMNEVKTALTNEIGLIKTLKELHS